MNVDRNRWRIVIEQPINMIGTVLYVYRRGESGEYYRGTIGEDNCLVLEKDGLSPYGKHVEPFLRFEDDEILQAFADELGRKGIYPQHTNKDKIKAEAVSDERSEQIQYLRGLSEKMIFKQEVK